MDNWPIVVIYAQKPQASFRKKFDKKEDTEEQNSKTASVNIFQETLFEILFCSEISYYQSPYNLIMSWILLEMGILTNDWHVSSFYTILDTQSRVS